MKFKNFVVIISFMLIAFNSFAFQPANDALKLTTTSNGKIITITLTNVSKNSQYIAPNFAYAGVGGGNLIGFISTPLGQVAAPCVKLDTLSAHGSPIELSAGGEKVWRVSINTIARWHCLNLGTFSIVFAYKSVNGNLTIASPMILEYKTKEGDRIKKVKESSKGRS